MSHTNVTPNFDLPQFTADDKPDWLVDVNAAFLAIDTGMEATQSEAESASSTAQLAQETAEGAAETAGQASSDVAGLTTDLETLQGTVNTVTALIGNGTPTTTDKTIIGAINELAEIVETGEVSVTADGVKTFKQVLNDLFALCDVSKVTRNSILVQEIGANNYRCAQIEYYTATEIRYIRTTNEPLNMTCNKFSLNASDSIFDQIKASTDGSVVYTDLSSSVMPSGQKFTIVY